MDFETPLIEGKILKRYKRFLADVELESGEIITAHTANTGSMKTCWEPGWPVLLSYHDNPKRKLKYSLEMTHNGNTWIGVNTSLPNKLAVEAIKKGLIPELTEYDHIKPEKKVGKSRIDLYLKSNEKECYVEIKNVTMLGDNKVGVFPDAISTRGQKHLLELIDIKNRGLNAAMLYIIQREDVDSFSPAKDIDKDYAELLRKAYKAGVEILPYQCKLTPKNIIVAKKLPFEL